MVTTGSIEKPYKEITIDNHRLSIIRCPIHAKFTSNLTLVISVSRLLLFPSPLTRSFW